MYTCMQHEFLKFPPYSFSNDIKIYEWMKKQKHTIKGKKFIFTAAVLIRWVRQHIWGNRIKINLFVNILFYQHKVKLPAWWIPPLSGQPDCFNYSVQLKSCCQFLSVFHLMHLICLEGYGDISWYFSVGEFVRQCRWH